MRKLVFDLSIFEPIVEDFSNLDLNFGDFILKYEDLIKSIIVGISYNSSYNDTPVFNGLCMFLQEVFYISPEKDLLDKLFEIGREIESSRRYPWLQRVLCNMLGPISYGAMFDPNDIDVDMVGKLFKVTI